MDACTGQTKDPLTQYQSSLVVSSILKKYVLFFNQERFFFHKLV